VLPRQITRAVRMHSRAEYYRRRGLVAKQRAAQVTDLSLREAFKDVARHWLALAERVEWQDRQHHRPDRDFVVAVEIGSKIAVEMLARVETKLIDARLTKTVGGEHERRKKGAALCEPSCFKRAEAARRLIGSC
jgi:hypothetical protein